jgi:hypothetical protein
MRRFKIIKVGGSTSGETSGEITIAECDNLIWAEEIKDLYARIFGEEADICIVKNTVKHETLILCIDLDQLDLAWQLQQSLKLREVKAVICFSMSDFELIHETYTSFGEPVMIVLAGDRPVWAELDWDLKLSEFDQDSTELIYDLLS